MTSVTSADALTIELVIHGVCDLSVVSARKAAWMLGVQAWGQTTTPQRTNPAPSGSQIPNCHLEVGNPRFVLGVRKVRGVRHSFAFTARRCGSRDCELHEEPCAELTAHTAGSSFPLGFAPPVCSRDRLPTPANRPRRLQGAPYRGGLLDPHPAGSALLCGFSPNFAMGQLLGGAVAGPRLGGSTAD